MPRNLKPLQLMLHHLPRLLMTRHTLRFQVGITLQFTIQKKAHPTSTVVPTCRRDYGLVNGIPVGYWNWWFLGSRFSYSWARMHPYPYTQHSSLAHIAHLDKMPQTEDVSNHTVKITTLMWEVAMHHTQDPGKVSFMDSTQGANRLSMPEYIASGNAGTQYRRLLHRNCASPRFRNSFQTN